MKLNKRMQQQLRAKAHALKPVVLVGSKGLTEAVYEEIKVALLAHELIKIKLPQSNKEQRQSASQDIAQMVNADVIQVLGNTLTLYKKKMEG